MSKMSVCALALTLAVTTCVGDPVTFYDPRNGAIGECAPGESDPFADQCIATYQRAGWVRMTEPILLRERPPVTTSQP